LRSLPSRITESGRRALKARLSKRRRERKQRRERVGGGLSILCVERREGLSGQHRGDLGSRREVVGRHGSTLQEPVRFLNFNTPAGWESYMRKLAAAAQSGPLTPDVIGRVASRYDFHAV
jgi:hypothetical protein